MINATTKVFIFFIFIIGILFSQQISAQHPKIPKEPFQVIDISTGNQISEALIIPLHFNGKGVLLWPPEGTAKLSRNISLKNPFVYKSGDTFVVKKPKSFIGLPLIFVYVGNFKDIDGVMVIVPGYKPLWTDNLWGDSTLNPNYKRQFNLTPVSKEEWTSLLENELKPLIETTLSITKNCEMWGLEEKCNMKVDFKKNERKIVSSFLQKPIDKK